MKYCLRFKDERTAWTYTIREQMRKEGHENWHEIDWYAEKIGYYKTNDLDINDTIYILTTYASNYQMHLTGLSVGDTGYQELKQWLNFVVAVAFDLICGDKNCAYHGTNKDTGELEGWFFNIWLMPDLGKCKTMEWYYYYLNRIFGLFMGRNGGHKLKDLYMAQSDYNKTILKIGSLLFGDVIRVADPFNARENVDRILNWQYYQIASSLNETIKNELNNYGIDTHEKSLKQVTFSKYWYNKQLKAYKGRKAIETAWLDEKAREVAEERARDKAEREAWKAYREAQMARYDRLCDKFGCALPFSAVSVL